MRIIDRLKNSYDNKDLVFLKKARTLYIINFSLSVGFVLFSLSRFIQQDFLIAGLEIFVAVVLFINSRFVIHGKYKLASRVSVVFFTFVCYALFSIQEKDNVNDIYMFSTYIAVVIIMAPFLCYSKAQFRGIIMATLVGMIFFYVMMIPTLRAGSGDIGLPVFISALVFVALGALFGYMIFKLQLENTDTILEQQKKSEADLNSITNLFESTKSAFNMGEVLLESADKASNNSKELSGDIYSLESVTERLAEYSESSQQSASEMTLSKDNVQESIDNQTEIIVRSRDAAKEITSQIEVLSSDAKSKSSMLNQLSESSEIGHQKLKETLDSLSVVAKTSDEILSVVNVIQGISSKTNLLAMNAAIEAAHAGDAGKGFAVVADEIRKLAEDTSHNSKIIKESMKDSNKQFKASNDTAAELSKVFNQMKLHIDEVYSSFNEIINGMGAMSTESSKIYNTVDSIESGNEVIKEALIKMGANIESVVSITSDIFDLTKETERSVKHIKTLGESMVQESHGLKEIGEENMNNFRKLEAGFESI